MKAAVRQMRGPGMNLGLKKPRIGAFTKPKPFVQSAEMKKALKVGAPKKGSGKTSSYLPDDLAGGVGKPPKKRK